MVLVVDAQGGMRCDAVTPVEFARTNDERSALAVILLSVVESKVIGDGRDDCDHHRCL